MRGIRPKQLARIGEFYLEESILDVLLAAKHEGNECIGAAEISKRASIYRERGNLNILNDAIVTGFLVKMFDQNRVTRCDQAPRRGGWKLTDDEFNRRSDDTN